MTTGDLARHLGIEVHTVRFWDTTFLPKPSRPRGSWRRYTEEEVAVLTEVRRLRYQEGYTVSGAKKVLGL